MCAGLDLGLFFPGKVHVVNHENGAKISGVDRTLELTRLAEESQRLDASTAEVLTLMRQFNETRCDPPLSEKEFLSIANRSVISTSKFSGEGVDTGQGAMDRLDLTALSQVPRDEVGWLWPGRIPRGKVTVISGEPDLGKSLLALEIAARVSRGAAWPDGVEDLGGEKVSPGRVILLNADDNLLDTVGPRLEEAGAVLERIVAIRGIRADNCEGEGEHRSVNLLDDLPLLRAQLESMDDVKFVLIDPITAYLGPIGRSPTWKTRRVVAALSDLAFEFDVAILLITDSRNTGIPSRVSWAVQRDPFDAELRLWSPVHFHYGSLPGGLGYRVRDGRVEWDPTPVKLKADELGVCSEPVRRGTVRVQVVADWLGRFLAGGAREAREVYDAGAAVGLSAKQVWRAKSKLGVNVSKAEIQFGKWIWELRT